MSDRFRTPCLSHKYQLGIVQDEYLKPSEKAGGRTEDLAGTRKVSVMFEATMNTNLNFGIMILAAAGCLILPGGLGSKGEAQMALKIESKAFNGGGRIPKKFTCEGQDISPPLEWSGVPADARSLVLIVDDPDAPDPKAPRMTWVHWVLYNIPAGAAGLAEGMTPQALPVGTREGLNDWKRTGYGGPCPPVGRHRYFHKLYALDTRLDDLETPTKAQVEAAMQGHVIARAEIVGTYAKGR